MPGLRWTYIPSTLTADIPTYDNDANNSNNVNSDYVISDFEASGLSSSYITDWDGAKYYVQNAETTVQKSTLLRNVYHIKSRSSPDKNKYYQGATEQQDNGFISKIYTL